MKLKNTTPTTGKEVVQVYVKVPGSQVERAVKELKGFAKVEIGGNQEKTVTIEIPVDELSYYDVESKSWVVENGEYQLLVGFSSRDIKGQATILIE